MAQLRLGMLISLTLADVKKASPRVLCVHNRVNVAAVPVWQAAIKQMNARHLEHARAALGFEL